MNRIRECLAEANISCEWILVDDKSEDATAHHIMRFMEKHEDMAICAIFHAKNMGRGAAVRNGLLQARAPVCGFLDIDLEVDASHIPKAITLIRQGADMVVGERRYTPPLRSIIRRFITWTYRTLVQITLRTPHLDTEAGFKFFRTERIKPIVQATLENRWFWDTEITVLAHDAGLNIISLPVPFVRRTDKRSAVRMMRDTKRAIVALLAFKKRRQIRDER